MILIDLLPEEYRQKRRTPLKFMVATVVSVAINTGLVAWWGWTAFGVAAEVKSELSVLKDTSQGLEGQVKYHEDLQKESDVFRAREEMLATVTNSRISWTRKTDELVDIVSIGGDGEKYLVWFDSLNVDQRENKRSGEFGRLEAKGFSGSDNFAHVANFLEDVEESTFIQDFMNPGRPEGSQSNYDEELVPSAVWSFPLELGLRSPEERRGQQ